MPNSLGTLSPPEVVLQVIAMLKAKFPQILTVATDFSSDAVKFGQNVISRVVIPQPVQDYDLINGYVPESSVTQDVSTTINRHKHLSLAWNDQEMSSTARNLLEEQMEAAAYSLGLQLSVDLWGNATVANFGTPATGNTQNAPIVVVGGAANVDRNTLLQVRQALVAKGAATPLIGIINGPTFVALGSDLQGIMNTYNQNEPVNFDEGSFYGLGFSKIMEYPGLPPAILGWFGAKAGLMFAARVPALPTEMAAGVPLNADIANVSDPDTGLTFQYRKMYNPWKGTLQLTITVMYGVSVAVPGHVVLLVAG